MRHPIGPAALELVPGDLLEQDTDAIVNEANEGLAAGGAVCGAILRDAGAAVCDAIGGRLTGVAQPPSSAAGLRPHLAEAAGARPMTDSGRLARPVPYGQASYDAHVAAARAVELAEVTL